MVALTISDAAKAIWHASRSHLYRLIQDGRLDDFVRHENGWRLIEVNGLAAAVRESTQQRINSVIVTETADPVNWNAIAERCNSINRVKLNLLTWKELSLFSYASDVFMVIDQQSLLLLLVQYPFYFRDSHASPSPSRSR
jgi:hypothetical protein